MSIECVLSQYPLPEPPRQMESLGGAGGFSGAALWRITLPSSRWCLRRWPEEHPRRERLQFIHAVLHHVQRKGLRFVPAPLFTRSGATFVEQDERLWELAPWMPGEADYHRAPSEAKLTAALKTLAEFHRAAESFPGSPPALAPSPGIAERRKLLGSLVTGEAAQIAAALDRSTAGEEIARLGRRLIALFWQAAERVRVELAEAQSWSVPLQPCIRDVWHDHVLFEGDQVSGLIDFGALRIETVAGDIARLLGSLVADYAGGWHCGMAAYEAVRPLSAIERRLVTVFDRSGVALSGMNWLRWLYLERRRFDDLVSIAVRLREICERLEWRLERDRT